MQYISKEKRKKKFNQQQERVDIIKFRTNL